MGSSHGMMRPIEWLELQKCSIYASVLVSNLYVSCSNMGVVSQHWCHGLFRLTNGSGCWDTECSTPRVPALRACEGVTGCTHFSPPFLTPPGCVCVSKRSLLSFTTFLIGGGHMCTLMCKHTSQHTCGDLRTTRCSLLLPCRYPRSNSGFHIW